MRSGPLSFFSCCLFRAGQSGVDLTICPPGIPSRHCRFGVITDSKCRHCKVHDSDHEEVCSATARPPAKRPINLPKHTSILARNCDIRTFRCPLRRGSPNDARAPYHAETFARTCTPHRRGPPVGRRAAQENGVAPHRRRSPDGRGAPHRRGIRNQVNVPGRGIVDGDG